MEDNPSNERENYSKVVLLNKEMVMSVSSQEEENKHVASMSLVQKRILEMSNHQQRSQSGHQSNNGTGPPPPKLKQSLLFAPKPFKSRDNNNQNSQISWLKNDSSTRKSTLSLLKPDVPPRRSSSMSSPSGDKPLIPPKPRNISSVLNNSKSPNSSPENDQLSNGKRFCVSSDNIHGMVVRVTPYRNSTDCESLDGTSAESTVSIPPPLLPKRTQSKSTVEAPLRPPPKDFLNTGASTSPMLRSKSVILNSDLMERRRSCTELQDLIKRKGEIRERILSKMSLLREERETLMDEKAENDKLGESLIRILDGTEATSNEIDKIYKYLEEVEQITKLNVGLNIRLNRVDKLMKTGGRNEISQREKENLSSKRIKLQSQIVEAEALSSNTNRRRDTVKRILGKHLTEEEMSVFFDTFLVNLVKFITELKEMDQRLQSGEEQINALNDSTSSGVNISSLSVLSEDAKETSL